MAWPSFFLRFSLQQFLSFSCVKKGDSTSNDGEAAATN